MMHKPVSTYCDQSLVTSLFVVTLTLLASQAATAEELPVDSFSSIAQVDSGIIDSLGTRQSTEESLLHAEAQVENEIRCLALTIYFEARSEPEQGQRAVGHVVMNRLANRNYPNTVCEVVQQGGEERLNHCQFSWWCDGRSDKPMNHRAWQKAMKLAREVYLGNCQDPTDGALWYHALYVFPEWSDAFTVSNTIGHHIFYQKKKPIKYVLN